MNPNPPGFRPGLDRILRQRTPEEIAARKVAAPARDAADKARAQREAAAEIARVKARAAKRREARVAEMREALRDTGGAAPPAKARPRKIDRALALLRKHPDWTVTRIAKEADCTREFLSRNKTFSRARKMARAGALASRTAGVKAHYNKNAEGATERVEPATTGENE